MKSLQLYFYPVSWMLRTKVRHIPLCLCVHACACTLTSSVAQSCSTLCDSVDDSPLSSSVQSFPGKNTGAGCHFLLQGIFLTHGLNSHLPCLLHWRRRKVRLLSRLGSPILCRVFHKSSARWWGWARMSEMASFTCLAP